MTELRHFTRTHLGLAIEFSTKDMDVPARMDGVGKDISLGGMFIEANFPPAFGDQIVVYLTLPGTNREMSLPAVVRWTQHNGMGVVFGLLGARDTHTITEFVKADDGRTPA